MLSNKPYLVRAFYEWVMDSGCIPILIAMAEHPQCHVPQEYVENGEIVLNISPAAVRDFKIANEFIRFSTSFSGVVHFISIPVQAVIALYAEETGQGIFFDNEQDGKDFSIIDSSVEAGDELAAKRNESAHPDPQAVSGDDGRAIPQKRKKPQLKLVE